MFSKEQYFSYYYDNGKTIDQMAKPNSKFNERQLESKYKKYCSRFEVKSFEKDERWEEIRSTVYKRDSETCQLIMKLSYAESLNLKQNSNGLWKVITPAHIFGKGSFPSMKYDVDNIITLNQWSHSCLDNCKHPINGKSISKEEKDLWWEFIVGKKLFTKLKDKAYS